MKSALEQPRTERTGSASAVMCGQIEERVNDAKAAVSEKLDDGVFAARRLLKRGRYRVEDGLEEAAHNIKQHPFRALAIGFAAGAALGLLIPRFGRK